MASLCISCPVQAGIISFSIPNSSFILDLLRLSIKLCAVFLAIFRPATLVELGCFRFDPAAGALGFGATLEASFLSRVSSLLASCAFGFMWMIFRDLVGGGGREKSSLV